MEEETGYRVHHWLGLPPLEEQYAFQRKGERIQKRVTYYFAEVQGEENWQESEIAEGRWVDLHQAEELATFPEAKNLCRQIRNLLS